MTSPNYDNLLAQNVILKLKLENMELRMKLQSASSAPAATAVVLPIASGITTQQQPKNLKDDDTMPIKVNVDTPDVDVTSIVSDLPTQQNGDVQSGKFLKNRLQQNGDVQSGKFLKNRLQQNGDVQSGKFLKNRLQSDEDCYTSDHHDDDHLHNTNREDSPHQRHNNHSPPRRYMSRSPSPRRNRSRFHSIWGDHQRVQINEDSLKNYEREQQQQQQQQQRKHCMLHITNFMKMYLLM